jgi:hypothetical protein
MYKKKRSADTNVLSDIQDGNMYNWFFRNEIKDDYDLKTVFTFTLNTDGISPSDKSNLTIWPVYLVINELPKNIRFCYDHVILAGLSVSHGKPNLETLFTPIIQELKSLEMGHLVTVHNERIMVRFFCLCGVFDKPARADIIQINSSVGFNSCCKCYKRGESIPTENNGTVRASIFYEDEPLIKRDHDRYLKDVERSIKENKMINGIKGPSLLSQLKYYKPTENTNIDCMHSLFYGVIRHLFKYWFELPKSKYSFKDYLEAIQQRMSRQRPPSFVAQAPRPIKDWKLWRCHEFMNFILYYADGVLLGVIPDEYYNNIQLLVAAIRNLFSSKIQKKTLHATNQLIREFLSQLGDLYDARVYNSGVHELVHLVTCTAYFGPIYLTACFQFEGKYLYFLIFKISNK